MYTPEQHETLGILKARGYRVTSSTALDYGVYRLVITRPGHGDLHLLLKRDGTYTRDPQAWKGVTV